MNRAPVLTLWATIVARRLGYDEDEALTLGKAVAGQTTAAKGKRLGLYAGKTASEAEALRDRRIPPPSAATLSPSSAMPCPASARASKALRRPSPPTNWR